MNTRQALQPSTTPNVLSVSISHSRKRFVAGLSDGFRTFRMDNCLTTCQPSLSEGVSIAAALDDRFTAYVSTHKLHDCSGPTVVVFYDSLLEKEVTRFDFHEPVLGVRLTSKWMAVVLFERTILYQYQEIPSSSDEKEETIYAPNLVHSLHQTSHNPYALACLTNTLLLLPALTQGQLQLISLNPDGTTTKRVIAAHNSPMRCMSLSQDASFIATAGETGTLIRVFTTADLDRTAEFRRGMDAAIIFSLAFSPGNRWLASTSDKGTLHIFDLRPSTPIPHIPDTAVHRKSVSYPSRSSGYHQLDTTSHSSLAPSAPSSAKDHGSVQEYYGLRPPPLSSSPKVTQPGLSALSAFKSSPFAPRLLKDTRAVAKAPFHLGDEQLGPKHTSTISPDGNRVRVKVDGGVRAPKGIVCFAPAGGFGGDGDKSAAVTDGNDEGAMLFVIGGGVEARWECFEVLRAVDGWSVVLKGFRRYLTRQFVD